MSLDEEKSGDVIPNEKIFLVGRSGNGKTSTVKSIERAKNNGGKIIAVECTGVGDIGVDRTEDIDTVINNIDRKINDVSTNGSVKAIVHVIKYGVRFTKQEKDAVEDVKSVFGRTVFQMCGILLLTYGDLFDVDSRHAGQSTFKKWCAEQQGDIKQLFGEVNNRVVLFNNRTNDDEQLNQQFYYLYLCISHIDKEYTSFHFNEAIKDRRSLLVRENYRRLPPPDDSPRESQPLTDRTFRTNIPRTKIIVGIVISLLVIALIVMIIELSK